MVKGQRKWHHQKGLLKKEFSNSSFNNLVYRSMNKDNEGKPKEKKKARSDGAASQDSQYQKASNPPGLEESGRYWVTIA